MYLFLTDIKRIVNAIVKEQQLLWQSKVEPLNSHPYIWCKFFCTFFKKSVVVTTIYWSFMRSPWTCLVWLYQICLFILVSCLFPVSRTVSYAMKQNPRSSCSNIETIIIRWAEPFGGCLHWCFVSGVLEWQQLDPPSWPDPSGYLLSHEHQCCLFGLCQVYTKLHPIWHNNVCSTLGIGSWDSTERKRGRKECEQGRNLKKNVGENIEVK